MKINIYPKESLLLNAFLAFFIVHTNQVGVGLPGVQRIIYLEAKQNAWVSIILSSLAAHFIMWIMIKTLEKYPSADLYGINYDVLGKWIGNFINVIYIIYLSMAVFVVSRAYVEIVQTWMFPNLPGWMLSSMLMILTIYGVLGGIRIVVGICVTGFFLTIWMLGLLYFPMQYAEWNHLLPILRTPLMNLLKGAYKMTFTIIGFEIIYLIYPYFKEKTKVNKAAQLGLLFTTLLYLSVMIVSIGYFSGEQLMKTIWATLTLFKIVKLPFIERFEYIAISLWMLVILPNLMLYSWAATKGIKRVFQWPQKYALYALAALVVFFHVILVSRFQINSIFDWFGNSSFYVAFVYPVVLYFIVLLKEYVQKKRREIPYMRKLKFRCINHCLKSLVCVLLALLVGCLPQKNLEELGLVISIGYDDLDDHRLLGTSVMHQFDPQAPDPIQLISSTAYTSKGIRQAMNLEASNKLVSGQLRVAVYGEELARKGIIDLVDTLSRDPSIGTMMFLTVSKGRAHELLKHRYPEISNVGNYIYKMLLQNIEGEEIISPTLQEFLHDYYDVGKDPAIPILERRGNEVVIQGVALFKEDEMVGEITPREGFYLKLLRDRFSVGNHELSIPRKKFNKYLKEKSNTEDIFINIENIHSKTKIELEDKEKLQFSIKVKLDFLLEEISEELNLGEEEILKLLVKEMDHAMCNEIKRLVNKMQKMNSDPLGFGEIYFRKAKVKKPDSKDWHKLYKDMEVKIELEAKIVSTGVMD